MDTNVRLTSAQRRPFVVQFRNAITTRPSLVGFRFQTEEKALAFAKDFDNHPYNNCRVRIAEDRRDGTEVREIYSFAWGSLNTPHDYSNGLH